MGNFSVFLIISKGVRLEIIDEEKLFRTKGQEFILETEKTKRSILGRSAP